MRDGTAPKPEPPSFDELAAFARSVIAGHEPHTGAQIQLLALCEGYLRLHEKLSPPKPRPIPPLAAIKC